jgi:Zn-dependent protease with chaperone function
MLRTVAFIVLTFLGTMVSFALFARVCEMTGFLDLVGWTYLGLVRGGLWLVVIGLLSTLYLARDVATWALKGSALADWDGSERESHRAQQVASYLPDILQSCGWRWAQPRVCIFPSNEINAISLSVGRGRSLILLSSALFHRATDEQIKAALMHSVLRLKSGHMTGLVIMYGMMIAMTLFPARMMALILGTSLRSAEEETPSDEVETLMLILHEVCLVALGSLSMRYFARSALVRADKQMAPTSFRAPWTQLLELDEATRKEGHRERFTAPFCAFDKVSRALSLTSYVDASAVRISRAV